MQWNASANAGFTTGEPWIMVNPNYVSINAEAEERDPDSVLAFYKWLIALRNTRRTLQYGSYTPLWTEHEQLFAYRRELDGEAFTIVCNMSGKTVLLPGELNGEVVLSNSIPNNKSEMLPYEARVMIQTK
jgi:glycosidase